VSTLTNWWNILEC